MNKSRLIIILFVFIIQSSLAQNIEYSRGGSFIKRVEYNYMNNWTQELPDGSIDGFYNTGSKTDVEKLLFGDFNAMVEFVVEPSFEGTYGFRVMKNKSNDSHKVEIKRISNWEEVGEKMAEKYPSIGVPAELVFSTPKDIRELTAQHNREMYKKQDEERFQHYTVSSRSFTIQNGFAEKLYAKIVWSIDNFKGKGKPSTIMDGEYITFRCVVEDEVWTLRIHCPQGDIKQLSDLCEQMISDIETDKFNQSKYIELLDKLPF